MTTFVICAKFWIQSEIVPVLSAELNAQGLADGFRRHCSSLTKVEALSHPHWMVRVDSNAAPKDLASQIIKAWSSFRRELGHDPDHAVMALGGRKDTNPLPDSPLQLGSWGVDLVDTADPNGFLTSINWNNLKMGRPADGVFEVIELKP